MYETNTKTLINNDQSALKRGLLRHNEYYNTQAVFDNLYKQSKQGSIFIKLYDTIASESNILLAYRNIKSNSGSKTPGVNHHTIKYWENKPIEKFLEYIRRRLANYQPQKVKRVEIPKPNGKTRPLGIPCIEDRIIQQCIKQVLEPICEAKFHEHSFGFRPNRSTEHAIAYVYKKINLDKFHIMVDIDIEGFFDNVNHTKLIKQIWTMGIRDKKVISIISAMLKAEVDGYGIPTKGVPQGGILSPLLSNIVLNELDWWVSDQWETFETKREYKKRYVKYQHLRNFSKLKEMYIVRYADDFKIICKDRTTAKKIFAGVTQWLKDRLGLDISKEKSCIVNVRKHYTEFLGFKIKTQRNNKRWVTKSFMADKAVKHAKESLRNQIKYIQTHQLHYAVYNLNRIIAGLQNYYSLATHVNQNFSRIEYDIYPCLKNRLKTLITRTGYKTQEYYKRYNSYKGKNIYILKDVLYPINYIQTSPPYHRNPKVSNYTKEGRKLIHTNLGYIDKSVMVYISEHPVINRSVEYNDNRLSLYAAQKGACAISGNALNINMAVHHILPSSKGGTDKYNNLVLLSYEAHVLIHLVNKDLINDYLKILKLSSKAIKKVNKYRVIVGNEII